MAHDRPQDSAEVVIPPHIYGFPGVGFGGYAAGILAQNLSAASVKVNFRRPIPLGSPVALRRTEDKGYELTDAEGALLTAQECDEVAVPPSVPSWDDAVEAEKRHPLTNSPFATRDCYGCGGDRAPGQGLRQNFSQRPEQRMVVAPWTPDPELGRGRTVLTPEQMWGALDCPGGWACRLFSDAPHETVTAYMATTVTKPVVLGEDHVTFGWVLSKSGRKHMVGSAIATRDGELCARTEALWLTLPSQV
ncbi:PaaI family thioesterase [Streptomyces gilvosporeus]|uniref:Thioesterase family protein n=1 Tax=Streptomyces gilvosporeus TaxID=553510 RepID=A0A1V0TZ13_9ACTN|nr:hypothetical protein [Streptomyces gilvosporeus]ARF58153.1 hypothetical protein B1H19_31775 [Streptomyces gilvosporeus]